MIQLIFIKFFMMKMYLIEEETMKTVVTALLETVWELQQLLL